MVRAMEEEHERHSLGIGRALNRSVRLSGDGAETPPPAAPKKPSDIELMKEKFAKLLLGEDMSGGGKGVSSALALSNAITNLAASVFGELKQLEPMSPEQRSRWRKEIDWLLSVTDHIVEFVAAKQKIDGNIREVMTTRPRTDLHMNIPALRKLDAMLIDCLDSFKDQNEFTYASASEKSREDDKWWIPTPKVPPNGLSEATEKWLKSQKDSVNQVLKAAMAINAQVLLEMETPENYIDSLPKNGRASLGDYIYKSMTDDEFDPSYLLATLDLTSEHKIVDLKNRIEASIVIWRRKMTAKDGKSSWGSGVSAEKREILEDRAETILLILKQEHPGIPQSSLDISKIQYNRDVGHAILESYSRIIESLAHTVMSRIDDVLQVDELAKKKDSAEVPIKYPKKELLLKEQEDRLSSSDGCSTTLSNLMGGWSAMDQSDSPKNEDFSCEMDQKLMSKDKPHTILTNKKISYIERLENLGGSRSPTSRH